MDNTGLKVVSEEMQIETAEVRVLDRNIEIILPSTKFVGEHNDLFTYHVDFPLSPYRHKDSIEFNNTLGGKFENDKYHNLQENGFRHISLAELVQILSKQSDMSDETYHGIMEALVMSNGYSTRSDVGTGHWGIYVDDGIRVEEGYAAIFKGISGKLKLYEDDIKSGLPPLHPMWNVRYHLKKDCIVPNEQFCVKRIFRKRLQDELKERSLILKDIYDASPDLIEYLFEQEFSDLPENIQHMTVKFPTGNVWEREHEKERGLFVMPMAVLYHTHISFEDLRGARGAQTEFCQVIKEFRIVPDMLSMPTNYCNSILPVGVHHWGVKNERQEE